MNCDSRSATLAHPIGPLEQRRDIYPHQCRRNQPEEGQYRVPASDVTWIRKDGQEAF